MGPPPTYISEDCVRGGELKGEGCCRSPSLSYFPKLRKGELVPVQANCVWNVKLTIVKRFRLKNHFVVCLETERAPFTLFPGRRVCRLIAR